MSSFLSELLEPEQAASDNPSAKVKTTNNHFFKMMSSFFQAKLGSPFVTGRVSLGYASPIRQVTLLTM